MRRALILVLSATACGRVGFDALEDAPVTFDAPTACVDPMVPMTCSHTATRVTDVAIAGGHACAIRDTGFACWGSNTDGQLGFCGNATRALVPINTFDFPAAQLAIGETHSCARLVDGRLWCWGSRYEGESGDGISTQSSPIPRQIGDLWRDVATLQYHSCGVATDSTLWCWGRNDNGELGLGDVVDRGVPTRVGIAASWSRVWTGHAHTCALDTTGSAYCWGENRDGELGDGTMVNRLQPTPVGAGITFASLSLGKQHSCGLDVSGQIWCWGYDFYGQLGSGGFGAGASSNAPKAIAQGPWLAVAAGAFHTCGLDASSTLWCWGDNSVRSLTPDAATTYPLPYQIDSRPFVEVAAGGYTTCVRSSGGQVDCIGANTVGQVGVGDLDVRSTLTPLCFGD